MSQNHLQEEITMQSLTKEQDLVINFYDDNIVIVDNIKTFVAPNATRLRMNVILICLTGKAQAQMNGQLLSISKNQILICPPNVIFTDFMVSPDFDFKAMFITNKLLQSFLHERIVVWNEVLYIHQLHMLDLDDTDIELYSLFYEMVNRCAISNRFNPYKNDVVLSILRGGILALCGRLKQTLPEQVERKEGQTNNMFQQFLELLGNTPIKHRSVEWYAAELSISPKHLSNICKKHSGKTANEWIREYVLEDIRYYLKQTDYSIRQVCNIIGFPNPSFFGKYVKTYFGMSPVRFRQS